MSTFETYLELIDSEISSPNDSRAFADFKSVKSYVLNCMRNYNCIFRQLCIRDILFGSVSNGIRIFNDDEYDVIVELTFPFHDHIIQRNDNKRPGFLRLDFSEMPTYDKFMQDLTSNSFCAVDRIILKKWFNDIIEDSLNYYGNTVYATYETYTLDYKWRGVANTIYATSESRSFSIDFVPAVRIDHNDSTWYAIPRAMAGPYETANYSFSLCNTLGENEILDEGGEVYRQALRLLQALCISYELRGIKCYHLLTLALVRIEEIDDVDDYMSLEDCFLNLLFDLMCAVQNKYLPFYWDNNLNLFRNIAVSKLNSNADKLMEAYNTLKTYPYQWTLSLGRCESHFE